MTRATAHVYLALWLSTAAAAAVAMTGALPGHSEAPQLALPSTLGSAVSLIAHNLPVAIWPLGLVAIDWPHTPVLNRVGDGLVTGYLVLQGVAVGGALGQ